jgi:predicted metal-dependent peptidase
VPVIQCDAEINRVDDLMDTDFTDGIKIGGGGGTSHRPVVKYINEMEPAPSIFISFTDGYSDIESCYGDLKYGIEKIIVMPKSSKNLVDGLSAYGEVLLID